MRVRSLMLLAVLAAGCDDGGSSGSAVDLGAGDGGQGGEGGSAGEGGSGGEGGAVACTPDAEGFAAVEATITTYCGTCHGDTPQFGAPQTLLGFDAMRDNLERSLVRLRQGTMPPVGQPQIPAGELTALVDWATCGAEEIGPNPGGFDVTREVYPDPGVRPEGTDVIDLQATNGGITPNQIDSYRCWGFGGTDVDRFIRRIEPIIDDSRVLHHLVLYQSDGGVSDGSEVGCGTAVSRIIYAWAPGQQPLSFPEGGLRTGPNTRYVLEIHYNNTAGLEGVVDTSGLRIFHGPPEGKEIGMLTLGPEGFNLPANAQTVVGSQCSVQEPLEVIAAFPHMHEVGYALKSTLYKAGQDVPEDFITLLGWDFNAQFFYTIPLELSPGDRIVTECTFRNMSDRRVSFGGRTKDEMCYNFVYVSPPPADGQCDEPIGGADAVMYTAGECASPLADGVEPALITGSYVEGEALAVTGGEPSDGLYTLSGATIWMPSLVLPVATLDADESSLSLFGTLGLQAGRVDLDFSGLFRIVTSTGIEVDRPIAISMGGPVLMVDTGAGLATVQGDCGIDGDLPLPFSVDGDMLSIDLPIDELSATLRLDFERR